MNNEELTRFFFAVVLLLSSAMTFSFIFQKCKMPKVIGEIFGGLVLGPSFLGFFFPGFYQWTFNGFAGEERLLSMIYWMGLILLMFISGFEVQKTISSDEQKTMLAIIAGSTIIPFTAGWFAPEFYDFTPYLGEKGNMASLRIIIGIAFAVTSIPVISKIFLDLKIMDTAFAKMVLVTATIHDIVLWVALAVATGLAANEKISFFSIMTTVTATILFFILSLVFMPRFINFSNKMKYNFLVRSSAAGYILFICFLFVIIASILDINLVFGAFLAGIVIGTIKDEKFQQVKNNIKDFSLAFFIPVYFAIVGLKLDLIHHLDLLFFLGFLFFSTFFETLGTLISARLAGKNWLSSINLGIAMTTRGGPGIVLATVAYDLQIINQGFFVTLILLAIITSLLAGLWFRFVLSKGWELMK